MAETLFTKIIAGEIKAAILHQDEYCVAIRDIAPVAPFHALVIPRKPIPKLAEAQESDGALLGHLLQVSARLAREQGYAEGFRVVINNGEAAGQSVFHLHLHVIAGRPMTWPPG